MCVFILGALPPQTPPFFPPSAIRQGRLVAPRLSGFAAEARRTRFARRLRARDELVAVERSECDELLRQGATVRPCRIAEGGKKGGVWGGRGPPG